ncbi:MULTISPECIES: hypothetical protein [unclassified Aeromicrobium]
MPRTFAELGITGGLWAFAAVYAVMLVVAWGVYARPGTDTRAARV